MTGKKDVQQEQKQGEGGHLDKYQELAFQLKYRPQQHVTIFIFWQTYSDQISHTASSERREETCCRDVPEKETLAEMFMLKPVRGKHEYNKTPGQVHALLLSFQ